MMNQLKGLLMREGLRTKHWLIGLLVSVTVILSAGPQVLMGIFGQGDDTATIGFMTGLMMLYLHVAVMVVMLITSLEKDMARTDIWFHTPASTLKLVLAKVIFPLFTTMASLIFTSLFTFGYLLMSFENTVRLVEVLQFALLVNGGVILMAVYAAAAGLFFWVLYRVLRSWSKAAAVIIAIAAVFIAGFLWDRLLSAPFMTVLGEIPLGSLVPGDLVAEVFELAMTHGPSVQIAEVLITTGTVILLFTVSVIWFDKKVRCGIWA
jgi:hypothetical protein